MPSLAHAAAAHPRLRPGNVSQPTEPDAAPIEWLDGLTGEDHVLVLGGYGPDLMCALIRAGATHVTHLRSGERPKPGSANLVTVPDVPSLDWLATALPSIRRALIANGRLVICGGMQFNFAIEARRMLALNGFTAIRGVHMAEGQTLTAESRRPHTIAVEH